MKKKLIALIVVSLFCFALFTPITTISAKSKVKLNKTYVTMTKKSSYKLKLSGKKKKVKWSSSKKSVATVSKKGVVKAKKKSGTTYITAKVGKKKYKCKVVVTTNKNINKKLFKAEVNCQQIESNFQHIVWALNKTGTYTKKDIISHYKGISKYHKKNIAYNKFINSLVSSKYKKTKRIWNTKVYPKEKKIFNIAKANAKNPIYGKNYQYLDDSFVKAYNDDFGYSYDWLNA